MIVLPPLIVTHLHSSTSNRNSNGREPSQHGEEESRPYIVRRPQGHQTDVHGPYEGEGHRIG